MNILGLGIRRDRHSANSRRVRAVRRPFPAPRLHRRRDCLLYAAPQSGAAPCRAVRGEGSGDESARAPATRAACSGRISKWSAAGGPPQLRLHGGAAAPGRAHARPVVAADDHAFRGAGDGAGAAARRVTVNRRLTLSVPHRRPRRPARRSPRTRSQLPSALSDHPRARIRMWLCPAPALALPVAASAAGEEQPR